VRQGQGALTVPANQIVQIQNKSLTLASLQFATTGGKQPYNFTFTQSNLPPNFILAISSTGLLTITRNTGVSYPANIQTVDPLPVGTVTVKVAEAMAQSADQKSIEAVGALLAAASNVAGTCRATDADIDASNAMLGRVK
jgi:hypothetical protein